MWTGEHWALLEPVISHVERHRNTNRTDPGADLAIDAHRAPEERSNSLGIPGSGGENR
jgi:hypothetical protein